MITTSSPPAKPPRSNPSPRTKQNALAYLKTEIDPILRPLLEAVAAEQPSDPEAFLLSQLRTTAEAREKLVALLGASLRQVVDPTTTYGCLVRCARIVKLPWDLHKPLDVAAFFMRSGEVAPDVLRELEGALCAEDQALVTSAIGDVHCTCCLPKVGFGTGQVHIMMPGLRPVKLAWENGYRMFDFFDPDNVLAAFNNVEEIGNDLRDEDLTGPDVVLFSKPNILEAGNLPLGPEGTLDVRASFAKLVRAMGPLNTKPGQPLIDCYMVHWPFTMTSAFQVDHSVAISDMWTIMEELVFEGQVRTLGISNFTARQAEQLLEICRIRPAVACFEQHPFCQTPELISFYREQKIAVFAIAPHAQAEIHSSAYLKHPRMTPAQACLHWAVEKGISVMPSAKIPAHIVENISVATIEDEPVVVPPGRLLQVACAGKINPGLMPYGICDGTRGGDLGVFDTREGKLFPGTRKGTKAQLEEKRLAAETQPTTGVGHPGQQSVGHPGQDSSEHAILGSINDVLLQITQQDSIHERRLKIDTIINEGGTGQALARMRVIALNDFVACGHIPRRSDASVPTESEHSADRDVSQLTSEDRVVFISQRWLCPGGVNPSPDDELGTKFKQIVAAVTSWAGVSNVSTENVFVWMDFCCVEQDNISEMMRGVNSLGLYTISSDAFITIEHPDYYIRAWCLLECHFAENGRIPRLVFHSDGELKQQNADDRMALKLPEEGFVSNPSDMHAVELLTQVALYIAATIRYEYALLIPGVSESVDVNLKKGF